MNTQQQQPNTFFYPFLHSQMHSNLSELKELFDAKIGQIIKETSRLSEDKLYISDEKKYLSEKKQRLSDDRYTFEKEKQRFSEEKKKLSAEREECKQYYSHLFTQLDDKQVKLDYDRRQFEEEKVRLASETEAERSRIEKEKAMWLAQIEKLQENLQRKTNELEDYKNKPERTSVKRKLSSEKEEGELSDDEIEHILLSLSSSDQQLQQVNTSEFSFKEVFDANISKIYPSIPVPNTEYHYIKIDKIYPVAPVTTFVTPYICEVMPSFAKTYIQTKKNKLEEGTDYIMVRINHNMYTHMNTCLTGVGLLKIASYIDKPEVTEHIKKMIDRYQLTYTFKKE